jgi:predicted lactoylglutathione lyase
MTRRLYVNLPVARLGRAVDFFTQLGFAFDEDFADETSACMVVNDTTHVMLLMRDRFQGFTPKAIADTRTHTEALFAVQVGDRDEVDRLVETALANGATAAGEPQDHEFMYVRSFDDPDGHTWEFFWLDDTDDDDEDVSPED